MSRLTRLQWGLIAAGVAVGAAARIDAVSRSYPPDRDQRTDVRYYYMSAAESALAGRGFLPSYPTNFIPPPGQAFFLYAAKLLWPTSDDQHLRVLQALVSIATLALAGILALELGGAWAAVGATWLLALQHRHAESVGTLLPETNYVFALFAFSWCLVRTLRERRGGLAFASGLLLGAACLLKPTPTAFVPVAAVLVWLGARKAARTRCTGLLLLGYMGLVAPWLIRNAVHYGSLFPISTNGGTLLALANFEGLDPAREDMRYWDDLYRRHEWLDPELEARYAGVRDVDGKLEENLKDRAYSRKALRHMWTRPGYFLRNYAIKLVNFLRYPQAEPRTAPLPFRELAGLTPLVTLLAAVGCGGLIRRQRSDPAAWALPALLAYLLVFGALLHITRDGRMNLPFRALAAVPAGCALAMLMAQLERRLGRQGPDAATPRSPAT